MAKQSFFETASWKKFVSYAYNIGASVVIIGAMFKILHLPGGDVVIGAGLLTEAFLFLLTAFEPIAHDYKWENVYPDLLEEGQEPAKGQRGSRGAVPQRNEKLTEKLDIMLKDAQIDEAVLRSLSNGIHNLEQNVAALGKNVEVAYQANMFGEQLAKASKNMESLNSLYNMQIESTTKQVEVSATYLNALHHTAQHSQKLNREMESMAENLSSLNSVYGGMLSAMGGRR